MGDIQQFFFTINLAGTARSGRGMSVKATHSGYKTYYIKDIAGTIHKCTTKSILCTDPATRFITWKGTLKVILDNDPKIAGISPGTNGEIDPASWQQLDYHSSIRKVFSVLKLYQYLKHNSKECQDSDMRYGIDDLDIV